MPVLNHIRRIQAQEQETIPWGINTVNVSHLWAIPPKQKVKICLIDTGYTRSHPDLPDDNVDGWIRSTTCGTNLTNGIWSIDEDPISHGTHSSGIIGATGNNCEFESLSSFSVILSCTQDFAIL